MNTIRRYYNSFRLFAGTFYITKVFGSFGLALLVLGCFGAVGELFSSGDGDGYWRGFFEGFAPMSCCIVAVLGVMFLNVIFTYNYPINTGYKYFHSLANGGKRFEEAIVFSNVLGIFIIIICSALYCVLFMLADTGFSPLLFPGFGLACLGIADLSGFVKNQWIRLFYILPLCMIAGFITGFSVSADEDDELPAFFASSLPGVIFLAVGAALFIAGLIYIHCRAEKKWGMIEMPKKSKGGAL